MERRKAQHGRGSKIKIGTESLNRRKANLLFSMSLFHLLRFKTRQIKKLSSLPSASFCEKHPNSSQHDQDCSKIKDWHYQDINQNNFDVATDVATYRNIIGATPIQDSLKPPSSMQEYFDEYLDPPLEISRKLKIHLSNYLSVPLTVYNALKKFSILLSLK